MDQLLTERITKIEKGLRRIAANYAFDPHDAGDIYGEMIVNIVEHSSPTESNSRIYTRAHWAGQHHTQKLNTKDRHFVAAYDEGDVDTGEHYDQENTYASKSALDMTATTCYQGECKASSAEEEYINTEMMDTLQAVMTKLTNEQRQIVALLYAGLLQSEIAQKLSVTPSAVNQRIKTIRGVFQGAGFSSPSFG